MSSCVAVSCQVTNFVVCPAASILSNSIHSNSGLGIRFNSANGQDPNNNQAAPALTSAFVSGVDSAMVAGQLASTPNSSFRVEVFTNTSCDPTGSGEGQNYSGFVTVPTDGSGNGSFSLPVTAQLGQVITATATSVGGNTSLFSQCSTVTVPPPPVVTPNVSGPVGNGGWYRGNVDLTWTIANPELVTGMTGCDATLIGTDTAGTLFTCAATNAGGTTSQTVTIKRDSTPPIIACSAADGVWHPADVSLACTAGDPISGLAVSGEAAFSLATSVAAGTEVVNAFTSTRQVCDVAGNCATAGPLGSNKIDKKAPIITISTPQDGATYAKKQALLAGYTCVDGGSGSASCSGTVASGAPIDTATSGVKTFTITSTDAVGNTASRTVSYTVTNSTPTSSGRIIYTGRPTSNHEILSMNPDGNERYEPH